MPYHKVAWHNMGLKSDFFQLFLKSLGTISWPQMSVDCPSGEGPGFFWGHFWPIFFLAPKMVQKGQKWSKKVLKDQAIGIEKWKL